MNKLLYKAVVAHGGLTRLSACRVIKATALLTGDFCPIGRLEEVRELTVFPHLQRAIVEPLGCPDCRSDLDHNDFSLVRDRDTLVTRIADVRSAQMTYDFKTPIGQPLGAFLTCSAVRTFLTTPLLLTLEGVEVSELVPWNEGGEQWRVLRAEFPPDLATIARVQDFFFGGDFLLRRHDYHIDGDTGITMTEMISDYVECQGIKMPTRLHGYARRSDLTPERGRMMISINLKRLNFILE